MPTSPCSEMRRRYRSVKGKTSSSLFVVDVSGGNEEERGETERGKGEGGGN